MKLLLLDLKLPVLEEKLFMDLLQSLLAFRVLSKKNTLAQAAINIITVRKICLGSINSAFTVLQYEDKRKKLQRFSGLFLQSYFCK